MNAVVMEVFETADHSIGCWNLELVLHVLVYQGCEIRRAMTMPILTGEKMEAQGGQMA